MSSPLRRDSETSESAASVSQQRLPLSSIQQSAQQRQSSGTLPKPRRSSTASVASVASSIATTVDNATALHTPELEQLSQNAISSLLSHPIVRTGLVPQSALSVPSAHRPPTARDIPPVTLTAIPQVESSAFKGYLSRAGALFDTYQRSKQGNDDTAATPFQRPEKDNAKADYFGDRSQAAKIAQSPTSLRSPANLASPTSPVLGRRGSSTPVPPRRDKSAPTPLTTIPNVYFEENFQLENPRTFDVVSERSDVIPADPQSSREGAKEENGTAKPPGNRRKALHTNAILQEKLSWYMDTVEVHLISSIATASSSFFAALGSLKELQSEASESITKIKGLREALHNLDNEMAQGGLEVLNLRRRRENLRRLGNAVAQLCDVTEEAIGCENLVDDGKLEQAETQINELENLIAGVPPLEVNSNKPPRIDLRQLKALDGVADGISQLRQRIGKGYESRFIEALLSDLQKHVESVPPRDTIQRWSDSSLRSRGDQKRAKSSSPAYLSTNEQLRPDLLKALTGLNNAGHTARAATAYREAIIREIKSLIRRNLPSSNDDDAESVTSISTSISTRGGGRRLNQQEKSSILARNLRSLDSESAEELLVKVYTSVGEALRRIGVQVKVVLDVTSSLDLPAEFPARSSSLTPSSEPSQIREEVTQALDMSGLLGQAVDVIQTQVVKVLKVRSEQNARLPMPKFIRYFSLNRLFTDECEAVSSRGGEALKEVINSQVKEFLQVFAEAEKQRIIQTLEADRWDAKDFGDAESEVLDRVLQSMTHTPKAWIEHSLISETSPVATVTNGGSFANGEAEQSKDHPPPSTSKTRSATIDGQPYFLVYSTISALHGIDTFMHLAAAIPSLSVDCSLKLLDYLKSFNSRCCQLILGAGATRSAGLKNITSKHLALASQACSFLVALVPYIREFVRRQSGGNMGTALTEFDKVKRLLQDHQSSIHEKLVDIMSQRCTAHIGAMKKIDWDAPQLSDGPNPYMESLTKETGTLYRVLSRHVTEMDLRMIMTPIFSHYNQEWTKALREAKAKTEAGKTRMLRDVEYLESKFSKMEGSSELGPILVRLVKEKRVDQAPEPKPASRTQPTKAEPDTNSKPDLNVDPPATEADPVAASDAIPAPEHQEPVVEASISAESNKTPATSDAQTNGESDEAATAAAHQEEPAVAAIATQEEEHAEQNEPEENNEALDVERETTIATNGAEVEALSTPAVENEE